MLTGFSLALINYVAGQQDLLPAGQMSIFPAWMASHAIHVICWISLFAALASIIVTLSTAPVEEARLRAFVAKIRPMGFWNGYSEGYEPERGLGLSAWYFALGGVSIYAGMFGVGYLLRLQTLQGVGLLVLCLVCLVAMVRGMGRLDST